MSSLMECLHSRKSGSALLSVMGIVFLIAIVAASMVAAGRQQVFASSHLRDYVKAQMIAEAGVNQAYNLMKTNFAARLNPNNFPVTSFDGGTYDAFVASVGSDKASITCTGVYGSATAIAMANVMNVPTLTTNGTPVEGGTDPFGYTLMAGGDLNWAGNSDMQMSNGWLHCNGSYYANGANTVRGNVDSSGSINLSGGATITGTKRAGSPPLAIPNIDLTPYYNAALANNQVYPSGKIISGNVTPPGGIMWVNGTLTIQNGTYNGCFIATGAIELKTTSSSGTIAMTKVNKYPLLASRDSTITIKQAQMFTFRGLIYAKTGSFDKQGNGDVFGIGAIVAAGNISKNGGWSGEIYEDPTPVPPGGVQTASRDKVIITAWMQ